MKKVFQNTSEGMDEPKLHGVEPEQKDLDVVRLQNRQNVVEALEHIHIKAEAPFAGSLEAYQSVIRKYSVLMSKKHLSDKDAEKLDMILERALHDNILNFWLAKIDEVILSKEGLMGEKVLQSYQETQKSLRKMLKEDHKVVCDGEDCCQ